jgi:hypothetical protein
MVASERMIKLDPQKFYMLESPEKENKEDCHVLRIILMFEHLSENHAERHEKFLMI